MSSGNGIAKSLTGPSIVSAPKLHQYQLEYGFRQTEQQTELGKKIESSKDGRLASSPDESEFLAFLVEVTGAKNVIEVGVFMGSTTLALAQRLPKDGKIYALDVSEEWTSIGREHWEKAGVADKIELKLGSAVESLDQMIASGKSNTFDMAFIDADKTNYDPYYERCLTLLRPGGIIAIDNVFFHGKVLEEESQQEENARAIHQLNKKIKADSRVSMTMLCIADGVTLCRKL